MRGVASFGATAALELTGLAPTILSASSTVSVSRTSSDSPISRRCSRYWRSFSLASIDQSLHAVENGVSHVGLAHQRQNFLLAVTQQQRHAIRVHTKARAILRC